MSSQVSFCLYSQNHWNGNLNPVTLLELNVKKQKNKKTKLKKHNNLKDYNKIFFVL